MKATGALGLAIAASALLGTRSACAPVPPTKPGSMPPLRSHSLGHAYAVLDTANVQAANIQVTYRHSPKDNGFRWVVCEQSPKPGHKARDVELVVAGSADRCSRIAHPRRG